MDEKLAPIAEKLHDTNQLLAGHEHMMSVLLTEQPIIKEYLQDLLVRHGGLKRAMNRQGELLEQHTVRLDGIDTRLDSMDGRLDSMDGRLDRLEAGQTRHGDLLEQILDRLPPKPVA